MLLGEHTLLGRRAAIKTLLPAMSSSSEIVERFFNEARAASAIHDPGVVQIYDFGYHVDGTAYIVMELLEGEALSSRIARLEKLALGDALRIARQIASSLATAHACDIVHRDLKPENIFLVADAEAQGGERTKILDFGICKLGGGDVTLTQSGAMVGTPVYMSPEQCRGDGSVDGRSDIYAFGCLVFHMLTGRPPFLGEASGDLIVAHLEEEPPAPSLFVPALPPEVDALVKKCMAKERADRYPSMTELAHELGELYARLDVPAAPAERVKPAMPLGRGFRSLYDGNFTANGPTSSVRRRLPWLRYGAEPRSSESVIVPRKRTELRVALGCLLTAGLVLGLIGTTSLLYGDHRNEAAAEPAVPTAQGATLAQPEPEPPRASEPPVAVEVPVEAPAVETQVPTVTVSLERAHRLREPARETRQPKPRLRSDADRTPVLASTAVIRTVSAPLSPTTTSPASAPVAAPTAPAPSEDLYETR